MAENFKSYQTLSSRQNYRVQPSNLNRNPVPLFVCYSESKPSAAGAKLLSPPWEASASEALKGG